MPAPIDAKRPIAALMLQGTGSDVGKSLLVAGLARAFTRRGLTVRPFKPQNMSTNAAVTADGGEIGRAQALQARACRVAPHTDMNPVLLKPQAAGSAQLVVQGRVEGSVGGAEYQRVKGALMPRVLESFARIGAGADLVLVEGAGSASEVNLRAGDIANMGFAEAADLPVLLVGDIDRGGVIAALIGTHVLLGQGERARVIGYAINKFRGDPALFRPAIGLIGERTGWPCHGIVPWFADAARLPAEDSMALEARHAPGGSDAAFTIAVPRLPHIANFDDLDPLAAEPDVRLVLVQPGEPLPAPADLVILPGSKATLADLAALRAAGWDIDIRAHHRRGGAVLGLCGGYQLLGRTLSDPGGIEGVAGTIEGLGLLDIETALAGTKTLRSVAGVALGAPVAGYEMHLGRSLGPDRARPFVTLDGIGEGAVSTDGLVMGTYLHGLFASDDFRRAFLARLGFAARELIAYEARIEATLDALAEHVAAALDLDALLAAARGRAVMAA